MFVPLPDSAARSYSVVIALSYRPRFLREQIPAKRAPPTVRPEDVIWAIGAMRNVCVC